MSGAYFSHRRRQRILGTFAGEGRVSVREALYILSGTYFSYRRRQRALGDTRRWRSCKCQRNIIYPEWALIFSQKAPTCPMGHSQVNVVLVSEKHYISWVGLNFLTDSANVPWGTLACEGRVSIREALYILSWTYFSYRRRQRALDDTRRWRSC